MNREEKIERLKQISRKEGADAKWKKVARWNKKHEDCLDDLLLIAGRLRKVLNKRGDQKKLAAKLGVSPQALTRIMKGRQNLTLQTIRRIEKVLDIQLISIHEAQRSKQWHIQTKFKPMAITYKAEPLQITENQKQNIIQNSGQLENDGQNYQIAS